MTSRDLKAECISGKWLPILVYSNGDGIPIVPLFETVAMAAKFSKRNLPKTWLCGVLNLHKRDAEWMDSKGWRACKFDYPRKLKDVVKFDVEILEFEQDHELAIKI